jgi:hypothetical protein
MVRTLSFLDPVRWLKNTSIFMVTGLVGNSAVTSVSRVDSASVTQTALRGFYYPHADRTLSDPTTGCKIRTGWNQPNGIKWTGACSNGFASGTGLLTWLVGPDTIWRTNVGAEWDTRLQDGQLAYDLDFKQFNFELTSCGDASYRSVAIHVLHATSESYFENNWLVHALLAQGVNFAVLRCPVPKSGYSNISVSLTHPKSDRPIVSARNYDNDALTWREFDNGAARQLQGTLNQRKDARIAADRQHAVEAQAAETKRQLTAEVSVLEKRAERLLQERSGTPAELATALQIDERRTLKELDRGLWLDVEPIEGVRTFQHDGRKFYSVTYRSSSLIADAVHRQRQQRLQQNFSWDDWFDQTGLAGTTRQLELTCLFDSVADIPKRQRRVRTELKSFKEALNKPPQSLATRVS